MKGKRHIVVFVLCSLFFALAGCRPKGVLSSNAMKAVLEDLHKTDAMLQVAGLSVSDREIKEIYYAQILERHGITQAEFDSSLVWYTAHPQLFDKIYPKVIADLQAEEQAATARLEQDKEAKSSEEILQEYYTLHTQLDTACFELLGGYYPVMRTRDTLANDTLMQDSINQFFP